MKKEKSPPTLLNVKPLSHVPFLSRHINNKKPQKRETRRKKNHIVPYFPDSVTNSDLFAKSTAEPPSKREASWCS